MASKSLTRMIFGILFLCVIGYMLFVFRFYIQRPTIEVDQMSYIITNTPIVTISGETKNIQTLYINSVPVLLDENGGFNQTRSISTGVSAITVSGIDRFDRITEQTLSIERQEVFTPPPPVIIEEIEEEEEIDEELEKLTD